MEKIQGEPISQKNTLEDEVIKSKEAKYLLGQYIGTIHLQNHSYFGTLETTKFDSKYFPDQFAQVIEILASSQKAQQDPKLIALLPYYLSLAKTMVPPQEHCLILLDLWPSQFLAINGQYSALIDIESYVVGPPGLELALLELWLGDLSEFKKGYFNVNSSWPEDLEKNRELYRYFLYLLYDCPEMGWDACRNSKGKFPQGDRLRSRLASPKLTPGGFNPYNPYE